MTNSKSKTFQKEKNGIQSSCPHHIIEHPSMSGSFTPKPPIFITQQTFAKHGCYIEQLVFSSINYDLWKVMLQTSTNRGPIYQSGCFIVHSLISMHFQLEKFSHLSNHTVCSAYIVCVCTSFPEGAGTLPRVKKTHMYF